MSDASASPPPTSGTKPRRRAPVACTVCRGRRTKCKLGTRGDPCDYCRRNGLECIVQPIDQKKRSISRSYVDSLEERIQALNATLAKHIINNSHQDHERSDDGDNDGEHEEEPVDPVEVPTPGTTAGRPSNDSAPDSRSKASSLKPKATNEKHDQVSISSGSTMIEIDSPLSHTSITELPHIPLTRRVIDHHTAHQSQSFADSFSSLFAERPVNNKSVESMNQVRYANRVFRDLPPGTHDYLMDLFWDSYNSNNLLVNRDLFHRSKAHGDWRYYSAFLHLAVLAMGFRYADRTRADIRRITIDSRSSLMQQTAKHMIEYELEIPSGLPTVQALLLLADLEHAAGKMGTSWSFAGMAFRQAFAIGLHSNQTLEKLDKEEQQSRIATMRSCITYDRLYALWHGRPNCIKKSDISIPRKDFPIAPHSENRLEHLCFDALLDLTEFTTQIMHHAECGESIESYFSAAALDKDLRRWYSKLPEELAWSPENTAKAPVSYFLLHQHFHYLLVLLYRPLMFPERPAYKGETFEYQGRHAFPERLLHSSRGSCLNNAIRIAQIIRCRMQASIVMPHLLALDHARVAATTLLECVELVSRASSRSVLLEYLKTISRSLHAVEVMFEPAERMAEHLDRTLKDPNLGKREGSGSLASGQSPVSETRERSRPISPGQAEASAQPSKKRRRATESDSQHQAALRDGYIDTIALSTTKTALPSSTWEDFIYGESFAREQHLDLPSTGLAQHVFDLWNDPVPIEVLDNDSPEFVPPNNGGDFMDTLRDAGDSTMSWALGLSV